jgi:hypothetical protein
MIWNSRKPVEKEIDGAAFTIKPFTAAEQAEFLERQQKTPDGLKERVKAIYGVFEWILETCVTDIKNLNDESGGDVDYKSVPKREIAEGFGVGDFTNICNALAEINAVPEEAKKKSSQPPESGAGA